MSYLPPPFVLREGERQVLESRPWISTYDFSRSHFKLVTGPYKGQDFRHDVIPWAKGIMDTWDLPHVREVILAASSQTAKTSIGWCALLANQFREPGPLGACLPDETVLKRFFEEKLSKHMMASRGLREMLAGGSDAAVQRARILLKGSTIYGIHAGSESSMSSVTLRDMAIDEEDAYTHKTVVATAKERVLSYKDESKVFRFSKPRGHEARSSIWHGVKHEAQVVYQWRVRCPIELCGHEQIMTKENIMVLPLCPRCGLQMFTDSGTCPHCGAEMQTVHEPERIRLLDLARYRCAGCGALWNDHMRNRAVQGGEWFSEIQIERPTVVAFHLPAWVSPFVGLSEVMAAWFTAHESGDPKLLERFDNDYRAMPYQVQVVETGEDVARKMIKNDHPRMLVPEWALALTCGIDMQMTGFWFVVRAWGRDMRSMKIQDGFLNSWDELETLLHKTLYPVAGKDETYLRIWRAALDIGGGKDEEQEEGWSKTVEAKNWLVQQDDSVVRGVKGASHAQDLTCRPSIIPLNRNDPAQFQQKVSIYTLDTKALKDLIFKVRLRPDSRQPMWLDGDTNDRYISQLTSEKLVLDGNTYRYDAGRRANHLLDCEVYAAACAHPDWAPALVTLGDPYYIRPNAQRKQQAAPAGFSGRLRNPGRINPNATR